MNSGYLFRLEGWMRDPVRRREGWRCYACRKPTPKGHIDHLIPWSKGGPCELWNLGLLCESCNVSKCDRPLTVTWLEKRLRTNRAIPHEQVQAKALARYVALKKRIKEKETHLPSYGPLGGSDSRGATKLVLPEQRRKNYRKGMDDMRRQGLAMLRVTGLR